MHARNEDRDLNELVTSLVSKVDALNSHFRKHNISGLSYGEVHPVLPESFDSACYDESRAGAIEVAERVLHTLRGPRDILLDLSFQARCSLLLTEVRWLTRHQHCASASLQVIQHYGIPHQIPSDGTTTYAKIAENIGKGVQPSLVERVVRHSITFGLFQENVEGEVGHNATSALLVNDPYLEVSCRTHR